MKRSAAVRSQVTVQCYRSTRIIWTLRVANGSQSDGEMSNVADDATASVPVAPEAVEVAAALDASNPLKHHI
jgi:hypothetical protein